MLAQVISLTNINWIPHINISRKTEALDIYSFEPDINVDFEENSLHQKSVISEVYQSLISNNHQNCKVKWIQEN